jgi:hypothetical protein
MSGYIRSRQVKFVARLGQVSSGYFTLCQAWIIYIRFGQVSSGVSR